MKNVGGQVQIAALLSFNGGFIDTIGFLGLHGLFAAHITGNFVTLGAALVLGTHGIIGKLLAVPEFILVIGLARLAGTALRARQVPVLRVMLVVTALLVLAFFLLAVCYGPFQNPDGPIALLTGFTAVAAMAVQNGMQRVHLGHLPTTTIMTGNSTQFALDAVDLLFGQRAARTPEMRQRFHRLSVAMITFIAGCAAAAWLYWLFGFWSLALPALVAAVAAVMRTEGVPPRE
ncbi:MAG TPA: YoaK family protein [Pseudolabrys sp.]